MRTIKALLLAGSLLAASNLVAEAKTRALLVGVADYNEASGITDLLGPRNDVSILWRALKQRGVDPGDITVLTDSLPSGPEFPVAKGLAEDQLILAELDRFAEAAQKGDTFIFYYSGHGTRQPDNPAEPEEEPETDGMDQVLLPSNVGSYDPIKMKIKHAIVDDEFGRKISAIRAKGAFVWAVIDACHSGTVTRGDWVTRSVDPGKLGVPDKLPAATRGGTRAGTLAAKPIAGEAGLVGFYAVESYDEAIERPFAGYNLPMVGEDQKQRMGVFTYLLHRALTRNTAATFRDLAQEIVAELSSDRTGGKVPPPVFDGDLDAPVPGSNAERLPNSATGIVRDNALFLQVGALQGFDAGAKLALYEAGKLEKPVAEAEIAKATAVTSKTGEIAWANGQTPLKETTLVAAVSKPAINFRFAISPPAEDQAMAAMVAETFKEGAEAAGIELGVPGNPDADVLLRVKNGRVWIVRPDKPFVEDAGAYNETPSLALETPKLAEELKNAVWSLAKAAKLLRVASALGESAGADDGIAVKASMIRATGQVPKGACNTDETPAEAQASPIAPLLPEAAGNCDYVSIQVSNNSDLEYYVAGFYVDALGGVYAIPARAANSGCVRALPANTGKALDFKFWIDTWDEKSGKPSSTGAENFVLLAIPKGDAGQAPKLCALTQPTLSALQQTRDAEMPGIRSSRSQLKTLLGAVGGETTRGVSAAPGDAGPAMSGRLFVFDVKP